MFKKVLIAEDHQSANHWVQHVLKELGAADVKYAYFCDDALLRLKRESEAGAPFELLITDLSFVVGDRDARLKDGFELIEATRSQFPATKILVFSAEQDGNVITGLFQKQGIDGYVSKGPRDTQDLKEAIGNLVKNKKSIPPEFVPSVRAKNVIALSDYDVKLIEQLALGTLQKNIPAYLQQQGLQPSSLSSVEKRLNQIRDMLGCTKNEQLVAYCKDHKII